MRLEAHKDKAKFFKENKENKLSEENIKREQRIVSKLNLKDLPFKIKQSDFCEANIEMVHNLKHIFEFQNKTESLKWVTSTLKKLKIFLLIFEANEKGTEIYKESIANQLTEYSYKTVASIIDTGIAKGYFVKLLPRFNNSKDLKINNIRPSEELVACFINWNIHTISVFNNLIKKHT